MKLFSRVLVDDPSLLLATLIWVWRDRRGSCPESYSRRLSPVFINSGHEKECIFTCFTIELSVEDFLIFYNRRNSHKSDQPWFLFPFFVFLNLVLCWMAWSWTTACIVLRTCALLTLTCFACSGKHAHRFISQGSWRETALMPRANVTPTPRSTTYRAQ